MQTPKEYTNNIKNRILTTDMVADCLFSVNKRAKNCRDKEKEYREKYRRSIFCDNYGAEERYREKKAEYYSQKEKLLSICYPDCIHVETNYKRTRIYDYEPEYEAYPQNEVIYSGEYFDRETREYVYFDDVMLKHEKFYLFYDFGKHSFHTPINKASDYPELQVIDIGNLITYGKSIDDLLSTQFVKKVLDLIESDDYTFLDTIRKE